MVEEICLSDWRNATCPVFGFCVDSLAGCWFWGRVDTSDNSGGFVVVDLCSDGLVSSIGADGRISADNNAWSRRLTVTVTGSGFTAAWLRYWSESNLISAGEAVWVQIV